MIVHLIAGLIRRFPVNIANFKNTYFEKRLRTASSDISYTLHRKLNKIIQEPDWPFLLKHKIILFYLLSFVFICFIPRCHYMSRIVIFCYSLSFLVIRCHSLSFVVTCCTTRYPSKSLFMTHVVTCCHSLSLVVTRRTTHLSFNDH